MRNEILAQFNGNIERARGLVTVYESIAPTGKGRKDVPSTDVLRAAVVFLHAATEELIRNVARWKYPMAGETTLNKIPLAGSSGRAEKFSLGKLASHRQETVQAVIDASVEAYLSRFTVNSIPEIENFLEEIGIDKHQVSQEFGMLGKMFARRHHIVHQADRNYQAGSGHFRAKSLDKQTVSDWINSVERFANALIPLIPI